MEKEQKVSLVIQDFIRFMPEEKRADYEVMLHRCNFHDSDDPLFPIMLFLLFFQESVSENVDRIEDSISELKAEPQKSAKKNSRTFVRVFRFLLIALTLANLALFGAGLFRKEPRKTAAVAVQTPQNELQEINRYWLRKLEEDEAENRGLRSREGSSAAVISTACAVLAWMPAVILLLRGKRIRFPEKLKIFTRKTCKLFRRPRKNRLNQKPKE